MAETPPPQQQPQEVPRRASASSSRRRDSAAASVVVPLCVLAPSEPAAGRSIPFHDADAGSDTSGAAGSEMNQNSKQNTSDRILEDDAARAAMRVMLDPVPRLSMQQLAGPASPLVRPPSLGYGISTDSSPMSQTDQQKTPSSAGSNLNPSPSLRSLGSPAAARRSVDEFGFFESTTDATTPIKLSTYERKRYMSLETEWISLLDDWKLSTTRKRKRIKTLCRLGIPDSVRARAWASLAGVDRIYQSGRFEILVQSDERPPIFDVIERDVNRCYPNHVMFAQSDGDGQKNLRKILRAYALYNPVIGYCQGMGMLAGMLLMRMSPEDTFWLLAAILKYYIPGYHSETLYELRVDAFAFELALQRHQRPLARHFIKLDVSPLFYLTQWFLTLYTMALPWRTVLRVWDMFLCDGPKALFRIALSILSTKRNVLIKQCPTSSDVVCVLLQAPHEFGDPDALVNASLRIRIRRDEVERFRQRAKLAHASLSVEIENQDGQVS